MKKPESRDTRGHRTRFSDASTFDEICVYCGATDRRGENALNERCPTSEEEKKKADTNTELGQ